MAPNLVTAYAVNSNGKNNNTLTTPQFTPTSNEFIVVTVVTYDDDTTVSGVSATANSPSFTSRYSASPTDNGSLYCWTTRITAALPAPMTIRATASGSSGFRQLVVSRWTDATVNPTPATGSVTSNSTGSGSITTVGTGSVVVWTGIDWYGVDPSNGTLRSGATALAPSYTDAEEFTSYSAYQTAASPGAQTFGVSGLSGAKLHMMAIELVSWATATATFSGTGSLNPNPTMQAALTGLGNLTIINSVSPLITRGRGKLIASPVIVRQIAAALTGGGGLNMGGVHERAAQFALLGGSALVASLTRAHQVQASLAGSSSLVIAGGLDTLTGPILTAENVVGYFALRDLGLATGDNSYNLAAEKIKTSLLNQHWVSGTQRFGRGMGDTAESLTATALGGLFLTATNEHTRAQAQIRHLRRYRVKNRSIDGFHVDGPGGLQGYRPYSELEAASFVTPPSVIDQAGSWLALLFASRFGEPIGEDVRSLQRWRFNTDDSSYVYGSQWLRYSADATGTPTVRARPYLGSAAWAYLLSQGATNLLVPDPVTVPSVTSLGLARSYDYTARRLVITATWTRSTVPTAAYELILDSSINGATWSAGPTIRNSIERAQTGTGYQYIWRLRMPSNPATRYRVRLRLRNTRFSSWVTSATVLLPTI